LGAKEEIHDDRHSVSSSLDEAFKDRILRESLPGAEKVCAWCAALLVNVRLTSRGVMGKVEVDSEEREY